MKRILPLEVVEYLDNITKYNSIIEGTYLNDENNENFKLIVEKLFPGEINKAKLMNPGSYGGAIVFNWEQSYYGTPKTNYKINWFDVLKGIGSTGDLMLKIRPDTKELQSIKANRYYDDGLTEYFLYFFEDVQENSLFPNQCYMVVETFNNKILTRKLYKISGLDNISYGEEVDLDSFAETKGMPSSAVINYEKLVIKRQCPLDYIRIMESIIYSQDRKVAYNDHNIMDYGEQWTILKGIDIEDKHKVDPTDPESPLDMDKLGKILLSENRDDSSASVEIVKNSYESITTSLEMIEKQFMQISAITGIPSYAFTNDITSSSQSGVGIDKEATIFYKRIELYQNLTQDIFNEFWNLISTPKDKRLLEFQEIATTSSTDILEIEEKKLTNGLTSKKRAIMNIHKVDEEGAAQILEEIILENKLLENDSIEGDETTD